MNLLDSTVHNDTVVCRFMRNTYKEDEFSRVVNDLLQVPSFVIKLTSFEIHFNYCSKYFVLPLSLFDKFSSVYVSQAYSRDDMAANKNDVETLVIAQKHKPKSLHLLEKVNNKWCVPLHSQIRITKSKDIVLDDGEL